MIHAYLVLGYKLYLWINNIKRLRQARDDKHRYINFLKLDITRNCVEIAARQSAIKELEQMIVKTMNEAQELADKMLEIEYKNGLQ
jgi:hypothetical protein